MFYKIDSKSRVFRWKNKTWKRDLESHHWLEKHIEKHPSIIHSIHSIINEWKEG